MKKRELVDVLRKMWKKITHPVTALAILLELPLGPHDTAFVLFPTPSFCFYRNSFPVETVENWFIVKRIDMARPAIHKQKDDALCFGSKVWWLGGKWIDVGSYTVGRDGLTRKKSVSIEEPCKSHAGKSASSLPEKFPSCAPAKMCAARMRIKLK